MHQFGAFCVIIAPKWYYVNMNVGNNLKKLRKIKKLTQDDVAKYLNISRQAYCRYENNQRELSLSSLCRLADFFEETTDTILGREPM